MRKQVTNSCWHCEGKEQRSYTMSNQFVNHWPYQTPIDLHNNTRWVTLSLFDFLQSITVVIHTKVAGGTFDDFKVSAVVWTWNIGTVDARLALSHAWIRWGIVALRTKINRSAFFIHVDDEFKAIEWTGELGAAHLNGACRWQRIYFFTGLAVQAMWFQVDVFHISIAFATLCRVIN